MTVFAVTYLIKRRERQTKVNEIDNIVVSTLFFHTEVKESKSKFGLTQTISSMDNLGDIHSVLPSLTYKQTLAILLNNGFK